MLPAARPAADVLYVGRVAVDLAVVALVQRQPPDFFADSFARLDQPVGELVIVREQAGTVMAQGDDDRARQGRQIDHQPGFEAILAIP